MSSTLPRDRPEIDKLRHLLALAEAGESHPGTGILIDNAGHVSALAVAAGQTAGAAVGSGGVPVAQGFIPVFNVQSFGAIGDGVHDDTTALHAWVTALVANPGSIGYVPPSSVAYLLSSELVINASVTIVGGSTDRGQTIIRATAPMRSMIALRSNFGSAPEPAQAIIRGITLDGGLDTFGNVLANWGILLLGSESAKIECNIEHCVVAIYNAVGPVGLTLGAVVPNVPGGSPSGVTFTQPNINYSTFYTGAMSFNMVIKVDTDPTKFVLSTDGGVTFTTLPQPIPTTASRMCNVTLQDRGGWGSPTGIVAFFPAGTYHTGDTWTLPISNTVGDYGQPWAINTNLNVRDTQVSLSGIQYGNAGYFVTHGSIGPAVTVPGTVAATSGDPLIRGTGTTWMSFSGNGQANGEGLGIEIDGPTQQIFPMVSILDDAHIAVQAGSEPTFTGSGFNFGIGTGGGYREDGLIAGMRARVRDCYFDRCTVGLRFAGPEGPKVETSTIINFATAGISVCGAPSNTSAECVFIRLQMENAFVPPMLLGEGSSGQIIEPAQIASVFFFRPLPKPLGSWVIYNGGLITQLSDEAPGLILRTYSQIYNDSAAPILLTSPSQTIPAPDQGFTEVQHGNTSYRNISALAPITMGVAFTPTVAPAPDGTIIILYNSSQVPITFRDNSTKLNNLFLRAPFVTLGFNMSLALRAKGGVWYQLIDSLYGTNSQGAPSIGNQNYGNNRVTTVSSTTPVEIYNFDVVTPGIAAGTCVKFDVTAESASGHNLAFWKNNIFVSDTLGNSTFVIDPSPIGITGGVVGGVPLGWALTMDPSGTTPRQRILVAGDVSGATVVWTIVVTHRDGGL